MFRISCELVCQSNSTHLQQLFTGFHVLHNRRIVDLRQRIVRADLSDPQKPPHLRQAGLAHLRVVVNKRLVVQYDTHDSFEVDQDKLRDCDVYFKRGFLADYVNTLGPDARKVRPLGLNYEVHPDDADLLSLRRSLRLAEGFRDRLRSVQRAVDSRNLIYFVPRLRLMEAGPDPDAPPKILFMARAFESYEGPGWTQQKIDELRSINDTRAKCIVALRETFGPDFYGGLVHTAFAAKNYPEALVPDEAMSAKGNYVRLLRQFPICVATTGLLGSIGWKLAEYVAFSKAILAERPNYQVPGDFAEGRNYLVFRSPDDCVAKARALFTDHALRRSLMTNNMLYYQHHLRPDVLVLNSLLTALAGSP